MPDADDSFPERDERPDDVRTIAGIPPEVAEVTLHQHRPYGAILGSTSHDGRYLWLRPAYGVRAACDLEALDNPSAQRIAAQFEIDPEGFLRFWTLLETIAKLENVPADMLLRQFQAKPLVAVLEAAYPEIRFVTDVLDGCVVTVGWFLSS